MALDDTQAQGGTLELVRGSHRWAHSQPDSTFHGPQRYREAMEQAATIEGIAPDIVSIEIPCGSASFHHGWVWHGSGNNRTTSPRRALVLHGISSASEFVPERLNEGNGPIYGRYKHPDDNQLDENHFPILWRKDGYRTPERPCPNL
jgi:ectoine hydroxylase-related dioxygenase (phytanoyl-CoA dioxygenase family)